MNKENSLLKIKNITISRILLDVLKNTGSDLLRNITPKLTLAFMLLIGFYAYLQGVMDRVIGSSNPHSLLLINSISYILNIILLFLFIIITKNAFLKLLEDHCLKYNIKYKAELYNTRRYVLYILLLSIVNIISIKLLGTVSFILPLIFIVFVMRWNILMPLYALIKPSNINWKAIILTIFKETSEYGWRMIVITNLISFISLLLIMVDMTIMGLNAFLIISSHGKSMSTGYMILISNLIKIVSTFVIAVIYARLSFILYEALEAPFRRMH